MSSEARPSIELECSWTSLLSWTVSNKSKCTTILYIVHSIKAAHTDTTIYKDKTGDEQYYTTYYILNNTE